MIQSPRLFWISLLIFLCSGSYAELNAQGAGLHHSCLSIAGSSTSVQTGSSSFFIQESIGQGSAIGSTSKQGLSIRQGFIQPKRNMAIAIEAEPLAILVYPNPTAGPLKIHLKEEGDLDLEIALFDISGRVILNRHENVLSELSIDLVDLSTGTYLLRVTQAERLFTTNIQKL